MFSEVGYGELNQQLRRQKMTELEKEVEKLRIRVTTMERFLAAAMSLPIFGRDNEYKKEANRILAKAGLEELP